MYIIRVRSIIAIFILTLTSGCVGYPSSYGNYGYRNYQVSQPYGARYPGPGSYGNYGQGNYQGYQPYREQEGYREDGYNQGNRGYGQYRQYQDQDRD